MELEFVLKDMQNAFYYSFSSWNSNGMNKV